MKRIYVLLGCLLLLQWANNLSAQVIFSEDFSSATGTTPPAGWVNNDIEGGGEVWYFDNPGGQTLNLPISDPAAVFDSDFNMSGSGPEDAALESPTFDASAVTGYIMLSFDHYFYDATEFGGTGGQYFVEVWDGTTWVEVLSGTNDTQDPEHTSINITVAADGASDAQVRFRWTGEYSWFWIVDNVIVEEVSCAPITDLLVDVATPNSIDISWTAGGSETDWNIEYGMSGFTPGSGTPGTASGTAVFTAGSLSANTNYDFYVQADCGAGDESVWIGPITGYTGFCEFEGFNSDTYINSFSTTGGATSNVSNLNSGYAANGYEDATAMTVSQFEGGPEINFSVDLGSPGNTFGFGIWVDWNDNMIFEQSEQMFESFNYDNAFTGSFGVPLGVAVGNYRMRILADYNDDNPSDACMLSTGDGEAEDYTFVVVPIPSCLPVSDLEIDGETINTLDISWTPGDTETNWNIEWGVPGFVPGTGNGLDSAQQSSSASFTIGGLDPSTVYDVYVQAVCSATDSSYWTLVSGSTLCAPITALPWTEDFESMTDFDYGIYPLCWLSENTEWFSDNGGNTGVLANSGSNFVGIFGGSNDYIWTPEFELTAGRTYEFSFMWAGDGNEGWNGSVYVNSSQSSSGAEQLGADFVTSSETTSEDYKREVFCFTPDSTGVYSFGVEMLTGFFFNYVASFDDFNLIERAATAGTNGAIDACQISGLVDLNSLITINDPQGDWTFSPNPATIINDSMFNPQFVPAGTVSVDYITYGCLVDTASVLVTIFPPSSAGLDGSITACKNEPVDLHSGLGGTVNMGGDWYNPTQDLMPNSQFNTGTFPGSFNYQYISGNGICPDDTASVVVTVLGNCNWLSVDENTLESMNVYPNPSTGLVYIESAMSTGSLNLVVTDINGRVIETGSNSITSGVNTINLNGVQKGTYFFKLSNENAEKVYRVVIQ